MLRAILSFQECQRLVNRRPITYLGAQFPKVADNSRGTGDFAVLGFTPEETKDDWRAGYYRLDSDLSEVNEVLRELAR